MNVTVFGTGYIGLVTAACLADVGNDVVCLDVCQGRIDHLNDGHVPFYEPGLDETVGHNVRAGRLRFTTDTRRGVDHGSFQVVAVDTPQRDDGAPDLRFVDAVASGIGEAMADRKIIVTISTVPVGTTERVRSIVLEQLRRRGERIAFDVVANPGFLKEGTAIYDFARPDRIILGTRSAAAMEALRQLYAPFIRNHLRVIEMDERSAEFTTYAANGMLASRISFMNELANIAEPLGVNIEQVRVGIGADPRIGYLHIYPGCGYGGSCLPKDLRTLARLADEVVYEAELLRAIEAVNERQKQLLYRKIHRHFGGALAGRRFALWGLSFKPETDDMHEAPSRSLMEALWMAGATVQAFDPQALGEVRRIYGDRADLVLCRSKEEALIDADALVILTEWRDFRNPDFGVMKEALRQPVIFDGRNMFDPDQVAQDGLTYVGVGSGVNSFSPSVAS